MATSAGEGTGASGAPSPRTFRPPRRLPQVPVTDEHDLALEILRLAPVSLGRTIETWQAQELAHRLLMGLLRPAEVVAEAPRLGEGRQHELAFFVAGNPETQGSQRVVWSRALGHPIPISDNRDLGAWRASVARVSRAAAAAVIGRDPLPRDVAVAMSLVFVFPRPVTHHRRSKDPVLAAQLNRSAPPACITAMAGWPNGPDLDKLTRAIGDAISCPGTLKRAASRIPYGRVISDDRQIDRFIEPFCKVWADATAWWGAEPGVHVRLEW